MRILVPNTLQFLSVDNKLRPLMPSADTPVLKSLVLIDPLSYTLDGVTIKWDIRESETTSIVELTVGQLTLKIPKDLKVLCMRESGQYFWAYAGGLKTGDSVFTYSRNLFVTQTVGSVVGSVFTGGVYIIESPKPIFVGTSSPYTSHYHLAIVVSR
jgi:hypothetical protein